MLIGDKIAVIALLLLCRLLGLTFALHCICPCACKCALRCYCLCVACPHLVCDYVQIRCCAPETQGWQRTTTWQPCRFLGDTSNLGLTTASTQTTASCACPSPRVAMFTLPTNQLGESPTLSTMWTRSSRQITYSICQSAQKQPIQARSTSTCSFSCFRSGCRDGWPGRFSDRCGRRIWVARHDSITIEARTASSGSPTEADARGKIVYQAVKSADRIPAKVLSNLSFGRSANRQPTSSDKERIRAQEQWQKEKGGIGEETRRVGSTNLCKHSSGERTTRSIGRGALGAVQRHLCGCVRSQYSRGEISHGLCPWAELKDAGELPENSQGAQLRTVVEHAVVALVAKLAPDKALPSTPESPAPLPSTVPDAQPPETMPASNTELAAQQEPPSGYRVVDRQTHREHPYAKATPPMKDNTGDGIMACSRTATWHW